MMNLKAFTLFLLTLFCTVLYGQNNTIRFAIPDHEEQLLLDQKEIKSLNESFDFYLPSDKLESLLLNTYQKNKGPIIELPLDGERTVSFKLEPSDVLPEKLLKKYPNIRSFKGISQDNNAYSARFSLTNKGFHGIIDTKQGTYFVDPHSSKLKGSYASYPASKNLKQSDQDPFVCGLKEEENQTLIDRQIESELVHTYLQSQKSNANTWNVQEYTIAVACTGEFTTFHGGTVADGLSAVAVIINRLNLLLERDLGIRLILMEDNDDLIFTFGILDPFNNGDTDRMLEQNIEYMRDNLDSEKFDIGHVLGTSNFGRGGVAYRGSACVEYNTAIPNASKAGGVSIAMEPEGDPFMITIVAHEIGHQLGANHSWNSCQRFSGQRRSISAFEPGSGSTIMSYAGNCEITNNFQEDADDYYHTVSLQEMLFNTREDRSSECPEKIPTGNILPEINIPLQNDFYIPISTPFKLDAEGFDANGDELTYCWEQFDLGPSTLPGSPSGNAPIFRSLPPQTSSFRYFPSINTVLFGLANKEEILPTYSRDLTFRCTVRDNNPEGGGVNWDQVNFRATAESGPFNVITPTSSGLVWEAGQEYEINWEVANTDRGLVNCKFVNILLSIDGGFTYPITLAQNSLNDGSALVQLPNVETNNARIMVEAADNIFFDVSRLSFSIAPPSTPGLSFNVTPVNIPQVCLPEIVNLELTYQGLLDYNGTLDFDIVSGLPEGTKVSFSDNNVQASAEAANVNLTIEFPAGLDNDIYDLVLQVTATDQDTIFKNIQINTFSADYSTFRPLSPVNGSNGVLNQSVTFNWQGSPNAVFYEFELATSPTFEEGIIFTNSTLADTSVTLNNLLTTDAIYYWRVRPTQPQCGPGDYSEINVFRTVQYDCSEFTNSTAAPLSNPSVTNYEFTINVPENITIDDINIPLIDIRHMPVNSLSINLVGPSNDTIQVFNRECGTTSLLKAGFDDQAPTLTTCPPIGENIYQPIDPLSTFHGTASQGDWTLQVAVNAEARDPVGVINEWGIELCTETSIINPVVSTDTLRVNATSSGIISPALLSATDNGLGATSITYTLISLPLDGFLEVNDTILFAGDTFTQANINNEEVLYTHNGNDNKLDQFSFIVSSSNGGLVSPQVFSIVIDQSVSTVSNFLPDAAINVYPNPTSSAFTLEALHPIKDQVQINLFDDSGRQIWTRVTDGLSREIFNIETLNTGIYLIQIITNEGVSNKKLIKK